MSEAPATRRRTAAQARAAASGSNTVSSETPTGESQITPETALAALQERIIELERQAELNRMALPLRPPHAGVQQKELKPKDASTFTGKNTRSHEMWLRDCKQAFRMAPSYFMTEDRKIDWSTQFLSDAAKEVWHRIESNQPTLYTFDQLQLDLLNGCIQPEIRLREANQKYQDAKQLPNQTTQQFARYLASLEDQLGGFTEGQRTRKLYAGLRQELRERLEIARVTYQNVNDLVAHASSFEHITTNIATNSQRKKPEQGENRHQRKTEIRRGQSSSRRGARAGSRPQAGATKPDGKSIDKSSIECFRCHKMGHYANECWSKVPGNDANSTPISYIRQAKN
jgi:hypothetical protein